MDKLLKNVYFFLLFLTFFVSSPEELCVTAEGIPCLGNPGEVEQAEGVFFEDDEDDDEDDDEPEIKQNINQFGMLKT